MHLTEAHQAENATRLLSEVQLHFNNFSEYINFAAIEYKN